MCIILCTCIRVHVQMQTYTYYALGLPVRSVLRASSMMTKLWSSLMPAAMKGNSEAEDAPVSITLHLFDGMEIALVLCRDLNLRIWSCQVCLHSLSLSLSLSLSPPPPPLPLSLPPSPLSLTLSPFTLSHHPFFSTLLSLSPHLTFLSSYNTDVSVCHDSQSSQLSSN